VTPYGRAAAVLRAAVLRAATPRPTAELWIPLRPRCKGNSRTVVRVGGRLLPVGSASERYHEALVRRLAWEARPPGWRPYLGPVRLDVTFYFAPPKKPRDAPPPYPSSGGKVGDRGNYLKLLEDALEGVVYADDRQVAAGEVAKAWALDGRAGYRVRVTALGDEDPARPEGAEPPVPRPPRQRPRKARARSVPLA
jgi:Holliday junction resolvase RusA-like endonuclease